MSRKFIATLSGTYNVYANELARGSARPDEEQLSTTGRLGLAGLTANFISRPALQPQTIKCVVHFLDDSEHIFEVDVSIDSALATL